MTDLLFRPEAAADLEEAKEWYETQRLGLGNEFLESAKETLGRIRAKPKQFPVVYRDTRRALLRRFPYSIFFRATEGRVLVVALMHFRRKPSRWRRRR